MKRFLLCALCAAALCGTANLMHIDKAQFSPAKQKDPLCIKFRRNKRHG